MALWMLQCWYHGAMTKTRAMEATMTRTTLRYMRISLLEYLFIFEKSRAITVARYAGPSELGKTDQNYQSCTHYRKLAGMAFGTRRSSVHLGNSKAPFFLCPGPGPYQEPLFRYAGGYLHMASTTTGGCPWASSGGHPVFAWPALEGALRAPFSPVKRTQKKLGEHP